MRETDLHNTAVPSLKSIFAASVAFGLSEREAWAATDAAAAAAARSDATLPEYVDELTGVLARAILAKERRTRSG
jgi:hypothetical protein